jgi:hypothetical protein
MHVTQDVNKNMELILSRKIHNAVHVDHLNLEDISCMHCVSI